MDVRESVIGKRLRNINRIICVASGKGGVGKSLIASTLALKLEGKGYNVGILDLDLYGPSSHIILGFNKKGFPDEDKGIIPSKINNIKFMSIIYFSDDKPAPFRGLDISNIIIELLAITQWGSLDYLIIDMPPGIGDETLDIIRLIKNCEFIVVTTPSKVAMGAVKKLLLILTELKIPILGVIENMVIKNSNLIKNQIKNMDLNYLGSIIFDTNLEESIGKPKKLLKTDMVNDLENILNNLNFNK
ncbi:MAG: ATP-binding protein [Candidatus Thermoplasmatota archaeon]|nr:ATP-binding protein [Candidatus Thermoplasmatota archaeon]